MVKALVLDLDGTCFPFDDGYFKACGKAVSLWSLSALFSDADDIEYAQKEAQAKGVHAPMYGLRRSVAKKIEKARRNLSPDFISAAQNKHRNESLKNALDSAKNEGLGLYVFTNSEKKWTGKVLKELGISDLIPEENIITREDKFPPKHLKNTFQKLAERLGLDPPEIAYFDDYKKNRDAARHFGLTVVDVDSKKGILPEDILSFVPLPGD